MISFLFLRIIVALLQVMTLGIRHVWDVFLIIISSVYFIPFHSQHRIDRRFMGTDSSDKKIDSVVDMSALE